MSQWNLWYDLSPSDTVENNETSLNSIDHGQYLINNVQFIDISQSGAITCKSSNNTTKMLINDCKFSNCTRTGEGGGAILFYGQGQIVQNKIYSEKCLHFRDYGHHSHISVTNSQYSKNYLISSSITNIFHERYHHTLRFLYGQIRLKSNNVTDCQCRWITSFVIANHYTSLVTLNNFVNLNSTEDSLHYDFGINRLSFCNIIKVNVLNLEKPVLYFYKRVGTYNTNNCAFCQNSQFLFKADEGLSATISHCYIDSSNGFNYTGNIIFVKIINITEPSFLGILLCPIHISFPYVQTCEVNIHLLSLLNYVPFYVFILL